MSESFGLTNQHPGGGNTTGGEMGALVRGYDWARTPLGPIAAWPQCLKTATALVLNSAVPIVMLWGPDGIMIYNDAYSVFAGGRHPRLLGSKVLEGWPEVADFNANVMKVGMAGGTLAYRDQELTLYRTGAAEQVWMNLDYSPVLDESGTPAGVIAIVIETTDRILAERRLNFLFALGEEFRRITDPTEITARATEMLGRQLRVAAVGYAGFDEQETIVTERCWHGGTMQNDAAVDPLNRFGPRIAAALRQGHSLIVDDVESDATLDDAERAAFAAQGVGAALAVPLVRNGRLTAILYADYPTQRRWTRDDEVVARDVAERTRAAVERAAVETAIRDSEERFRALVQASSDVIYQMSADWHELRELAGRNFIADTTHVSRTWLQDYIFPEDQKQVTDAIDEAIRGKSPFELEHRVRRVDGTVGWTLSRAVPLLDRNGEIAQWFGAASDVTARRQTQEHLRLLVDELNHRVKNTLATVQSIVTQVVRGMPHSEDVRGAIESRLGALSRSHDLLTRESWETASLQDIADQALRPFVDGNADQLTITGDEIRFRPKIALALGMAFHELATNAAKYGALSTSAGRIVITWSTADDRLRLQWRERGGPAVVPPEKKGFGSRLIERGLAYDLDGSVRLDYAPAGVTCDIEMPLAAGAPKT